MGAHALAASRGSKKFARRNFFESALTRIGATINLEIDIDPSGNDRVHLTAGTATLGGTINVNLLGGFDPALGQAFDVLDAFDIIGNPVVTGLTPSGHMFVSSIEPTIEGETLRLTVTQVPEPGIFPLAAAAALALSHGRLRKRKPKPPSLR